MAFTRKFKRLVLYIVILYVMYKILVYLSKKDKSEEKTNELLIKLKGPERNLNYIPENKSKKNVFHFSTHVSSSKELRVLSTKIGFNVKTQRIMPEKIDKCTREDGPYCNSKLREICSNYEYLIFSEILYEAKPFIVNQCDSKIILHLTGKFDDFVLEDDYENFLKILNEAIKQERVTIVVNNYSSLYYACKMGLNIKKYIFARSTGYSPDIDISIINDENQVGIPNETFGVFNRYPQDEILIGKLKKNNIKYNVLDYQYGGPKILSRYKAIILFPHSPTNYSLMENIKNEVVFFIPSKSFIKKTNLRKDISYEFSGFNDLLKTNEKEMAMLIDWYSRDLYPNFEFFNSWSDLMKKLTSTDFEAKQKIMREFNYYLEKENIYKWKIILGYKTKNDTIFEYNDIPLCQQEKIN